MNLERVSNEEKLNLCRKYYLGKGRARGVLGEEWTEPEGRPRPRRGLLGSF